MSEQTAPEFGTREFDQRWDAAARLIGLFDGDHDAARDLLQRVWRAYFPRKAG